MVLLLVSHRFLLEHPFSFKANKANIVNLIVNALISWPNPKINPIWVGGGGRQKAPPTSFSVVTFTNVGTSPKKFLTFTFNPFAHYCKISSLYLVPIRNYWTWTKTTPQNKKRFFWSNPYKIEIMITFLIEMMRLPNFGHMTTSII